MPRNYHLHLTGYVGCYSFDSEFVNWKIGKVSGQLDVLIESRGGSLFHGLAISSALARHGNAHVHFVGFNASAATIASMGAKHISMDENAMYLVHECSTRFLLVRDMNKSELENYIKSLEKSQRELTKLDNNVAALYAKRCKKPKAELLELMKQDTWLTAQEALDWGFIDEITNHKDDPKAVLTDAIRAEFSANNIPVPCMDSTGTSAGDTGQSDKNLFDRIMTLFNKKLTTEPYNMNLECTHFCAASGLTAVESSADNKVTLSAVAILKAEARLDSLTKELSDAKARISELETTNASHVAEISALKDAQKKTAEAEEKKPAANSTDVVDDAPAANEEDDEYTAFCKMHEETVALYNSLP